MGLLDDINLPGGIRKLTLTQLKRLSEEIRKLVIDTVAVTGGHLAPNLGVVELTIALHKVFNTPYDKIIWDVGHQSYIHKILTGRKDIFHTLRQMNGLCGFPKRSESMHDAFGAGHSSTSISAGLGMAIARDLSGDKYHVISVIGDGSLTGGMAFEALNNAGDIGTNITIILNDNEMSIAKNVGALSEYLYRMRTAPTYARIKRDVEYILKSIPAIGDRVARTAERVKDSLKYFLVPGMLFEDLGFKYIGPVDGHDIDLLTDILEKTKTITGPILVHVVTTKGKGYKFAEENAGKFHGIGPFCIETGELRKSSTTPSYTDIFGKTLVEIADKNKDVIAITAAMPEGTGLRDFSQKYPERFFDVGIAEQHAVTMAAGMACQKKRPVVAIYSTFMQRGYDQILHDICLQNLPVCLALDRSGVVGEDGATHHGVFDFSYLRHIPNIAIMAPKDENELRHMLYTALSMDGPSALRYPRGAGYGVEINEPLKRLEMGKSEILTWGKDVIFFAAGTMVYTAVEASKLLAKSGISAGVVNARFVKPLDGEVLRKIAREVGVIVTIEENTLAGGFGSAVLEYLNEHNFNWVKLLRLGLPDIFIEHGTRIELLEKYNLTAPKIALTVKAYLQQYGVK